MILLIYNPTRVNNKPIKCESKKIFVYCTLYTTHCTFSYKLKLSITNTADQPS